MSGGLIVHRGKMTDKEMDQEMDLSEMVRKITQTLDLMRDLMRDLIRHLQMGRKIKQMYRSVCRVMDPRQIIACRVKITDHLRLSSLNYYHVFKEDVPLGREQSDSMSSIVNSKKLTVYNLEKESLRIATREVISEFGSLKMKVVKKTRDNYLNVKDKLYKHILPLLKEKLSMSDFETMNKLKLFGPSYLGKTVKWYNPSALKDIAETIGCTEDYKHYIEVFHSYISERVMYNNNTCGDISVLIDEEWGIVDTKVMDLSDVIDAVKKAVVKKESAKKNEIVAQKGATEDDEKVVVTVSMQEYNRNYSRATGQNEGAEYLSFTQSELVQGYQLPDQYARERKSGDQNSFDKAVEPTDQNAKEAKRCRLIRHINLIQIV